MNYRHLVGFFGLAVASTSACAPAEWRRAHAALAEARYPDALDELARVEVRDERVRPCFATRYALERGLAHLAVGDADRAARWLGHTWALDKAHPRCLEPTARERLEAGWRALGWMPGER